MSCLSDGLMGFCCPSWDSMRNGTLPGCIGHGLPGATFTYTHPWKCMTAQCHSDHTLIQGSLWWRYLHPKQVWPEVQQTADFFQVCLDLCGEHSYLRASISVWDLDSPCLYSRKRQWNSRLFSNSWMIGTLWSENISQCWLFLPNETTWTQKTNK